MNDIQYFLTSTLVDENYSSIPESHILRVVNASDYGAAMTREAALRESLTDKREEYNKLGDRYDALQQRMTVAEQRTDEMERLLRGALRHVPHYGKSDWQGSLRHKINEELKPATEGEAQ